MKNCVVLPSAKIASILSLLLIFSLTSIPAWAQKNYERNSDTLLFSSSGDVFSTSLDSHAINPQFPPFAEFVIPVDPVGTQTLPFSATFDCEPCFLGFGLHRYDFTLLAAADVVVEIEDVQFEDLYEIRYNNRGLDEDEDPEVDPNNHEEDCIFGRQTTPDVPDDFTFSHLGRVTLEPGDWSIRIRAVSIQCGTTLPAPTIDQSCPAGYILRFHFLAPSDIPCECLDSCFNDDNAADVSRDDVDSEGNSCLDTSFSSCVVLNEPPDCSQAAATPGELWPPNHKKVDLIDIAGVTDPDGDPVTITVDGIFQDEEVLAPGKGSGHTAPDAFLDPPSVRRERDGTGNGRVYTIDFTADDGQGGSCQGTVAVCVPHDQRKGHVCIDDGPLFDSTVSP
jgi:hypothetical protein